MSTYNWKESHLAWMLGKLSVRAILNGGQPESDRVLKCLHKIGIAEFHFYQPRGFPSLKYLIHVSLEGGMVPFLEFGREGWKTRIII